ncbi:MAG: hypothetical protein KKD77_23315 [Gammaproteobacteria bacterium]|nr:hypothetical protein [Gammaproteobacteria bacterium]
MANEFKHITKGTSLTQAEFEHIDLHACNSQATGDLIYASSATQLSRLGITNNRILISSGGVPTWSATLPAVTLGGSLNANGSSITGFNGFYSFDSQYSFLQRTGAKGFTWRTANLADNAGVERLNLSGGIAIAVATWGNVTHTGIKLSGGIDVNGTTFTNTGGAWTIPAVTLGGNMTVTGYGFVGPVISTNSYMGVTEMAAPGAGAANTARIYAVVGGDTLTDLAAVFQDGTVDIFAQETTPLDSPIFTEADGTEIKMVQLKPHPGIIQFVVKYPNGKTHVLKEIQYHNEDKIKANMGAKASLPLDWEVETTAEMEARLAKLEQDRLDAVEAAKVLPQAEDKK